MRFRPVDEDPMYLAMRNFRRNAEERVVIDFSDAPIAKMYPMSNVCCKYCDSPSSSPCSLKIFRDCPNFISKRALKQSEEQNTDLEDTQFAQLPEPSGRNA